MLLCGRYFFCHSWTSLKFKAVAVSYIFLQKEQESDASQRITAKFRKTSDREVLDKLNSEENRADYIRQLVLKVSVK